MGDLFLVTYLPVYFNWLSIFSASLLVSTVGLAPQDVNLRIASSLCLLCNLTNALCLQPAFEKMALQNAQLNNENPSDTEEQNTIVQAEYATSKRCLHLKTLAAWCCYTSLIGLTPNILKILIV
ncbi:hypothetical protein IE077_001875 [Cardiosporidium cionae]|uniref:Uncharacterized protein n=1 Tax=Cardiosporidium cionae TaxID=476202 RepID=A0ABQ7JD56_9APIC|nr:hypothetical protein IE077_001875 [Cardiosporidium cionae]|eukprot:KAF8821560.1 hypothetical protein IE077_001875 [Cardiosporidium cionae]